MTPWANCVLRQPHPAFHVALPAPGRMASCAEALDCAAQPDPGQTAPCVSPQPAFSIAIPTQGVVRAVWDGDGNGNSLGQRHNRHLLGDMGDRFTGTGNATGSDHGHGSNGRQINDNYNNYDQEVNVTNIDPVCPSTTGMLAEGANQR